jgi:hypothetical protein
MSLSRLARISEDLTNVKSLPEVSSWFVIEILQCSLERDSLKAIFDKAGAKYESQAMPSLLSAEDRFLFSKLGSVNYHAYKAMVGNATALEAQEVSLKNTKEASSNSPSPSSQKTVGILLQLSRPYKSIYGTAATPPDKLDVMCSAIFEVKRLLGEGKKLKIGGKTCNCYRQLYQYGKIVGCLFDCFGGNKKVFLETYPSLALANFKCVNKKKHSLTA